MDCVSYVTDKPHIMALYSLNNDTHLINDIEEFETSLYQNNIIFYPTTEFMDSMEQFQYSTTMDILVFVDESAQVYTSKQTINVTNY